MREGGEEIVFRKPVGVIVLAVALGAVLLVTSGMKVGAGGFIETRSSEGKELSGNKGIFVKGYMYGPGEAAVEKGRETTYTVRKGECLWKIAGYRHIYGDPFKWTQIYKANKDKIRNPDFIYPGQVLVIPR